MKILVVEDDILIAEDLKDILSTFGFEYIYLAHNKPDAISLIKKISRMYAFWILI